MTSSLSLRLPHCHGDTVVNQLSQIKIIQEHTPLPHATGTGCQLASVLFFFGAQATRDTSSGTDAVWCLFRDRCTSIGRAFLSPTTGSKGEPSARMGTTPPWDRGASSINSCGIETNYSRAPTRSPKSIPEDSVPAPHSLLAWLPMSSPICPPRPLPRPLHQCRGLLIKCFQEHGTPQLESHSLLHSATLPLKRESLVLMSL